MLNNITNTLSLIALCAELRSLTEAHCFERDLVAEFWNDGDVNLSWLLVVVAEQVRCFEAIDDMHDFDLDTKADACALSECEYCGEVYQYITDHDCYGTRGENGEAQMRSESEMDYFAGYE